LNYLELLEKNILEKKTLKIELNSTIYTKSTILKSTYKFTDKVYIYITSNEENQFIIYFTPKDTFLIDSLSGEFMNELLDQELRSTINKETSKIRDIIVTRALLSGQNNE